MVKNLPANAEDVGLIPGLGRSHMPQSNEAREPQPLSLSSRAHEPLLLSPRALEPVLCKNRSHHGEGPADCSERSLRLKKSQNSYKDPAQPIKK